VNAPKSSGVTAIKPPASRIVEMRVAKADKRAILAGKK
jgi:hypothetical protein